MKLVLAIAAVALAIPARAAPPTIIMQFPQLNCGTAGWQTTPDPRDKTRKIAHCGKTLKSVPDVAVGLERVCASVKEDKGPSGTVLTCVGSKP